MSGLELFESCGCWPYRRRPCSLSPVMLMKICSGTLSVWAPLHFCVN
jgi:hypothetical protein